MNFKSIWCTAVTLCLFSNVFGQLPWGTDFSGLVTNGNVHAIESKGDTVYIGGDFSYVGPSTGYGALLDKNGTEMKVPLRFYSWQSICAVADGNNGWFVHGPWLRNDPNAMPSGLHIKSDGTEEYLYDYPNIFYVNSMVCKGDTLIYGGSVAGHYGIQAYNAKTGDSLFSIKTEGGDEAVYSILLLGNKLFFSGSFTQVNGTSRGNAAAIDLNNLKLTSWDPKFDKQVFSLATNGKTIFAGGFFDYVNSTYRQKLAEVDTASGKATSWSCPVTTAYYSNLKLAVTAITLQNNNLYVAGNFQYLNSSYRIGIGVVNAVTGQATSTVVSSNHVDVYNLTSANGLVYISGIKNRAGSYYEPFLLIYDAATGGLKKEVYSTDIVETVVPSGNQILTSGEFTSIGGEPRNNLAAFDAKTNKPLPWNPNVNGIVTNIEPAGKSVYIAGLFTQVGGLSRPNITGIDAGTGKPVSWYVSTNDSVKALAIYNGKLYVGGKFTKLNGSAYSQMGKINTSTGVIENFYSITGKSVNCMLIDNDILYIGGDFTKAGSLNRVNAAAISLTSGPVNTWDIGLSGKVNDIEKLGNNLYFAGQFLVVKGDRRDALAAVRISDGKLLPFKLDTNFVKSLMIIRANDKSLIGSNGYGAGLIDTAFGIFPYSGYSSFGIVKSLLPHGNNFYLGSAGTYHWETGIRKHSYEPMEGLDDYLQGDFGKAGYLQTYKLCDLKGKFSGNRNVCNKHIEKYIVDVSHADLYFWNVKGGKIVGDQRDKAVYVEWDTTSKGYLSLYIIKESCSLFLEDSITVNSEITKKTFEASNLCQNDFIFFTDSNSTIPNRTWYFGDGSTSTDISPKHKYTNSGTYTVKIVWENGGGCKDSIEKQISIHESPKAAFTASHFCVQDSAVFSNSSTLVTGTIKSYLWKFGDGTTSTLANPHKKYSSVGTYTVTLLAFSDSGCVDSIQKQIIIDSSCVWPGDANADKVVNTKDILAIGLAYADTGSGRIDTSTTWTAHAATDWTKSFKSGQNHKHADCDGSGVVGLSDTSAVRRNYSKAHLKTFAKDQGNPGDAPFYLSIRNDRVYKGDTLVADVVLGSQSKPANIYGAIFSVLYNNTALNVLDISFNGSANWVDPAGNKHIGFLHSDEDVLDFALTRINQQNISGYGPIATVRFTVNQDIPDNLKALKLELGNNLLITANEQKVPTYVSDDSVKVQEKGSGLEDKIKTGFTYRVVPNPFNENTTISYSLSNMTPVSIYLIDMTGKVYPLQSTTTQQVGTYSYEVQGEKLKPGVYILSLNVGGNVYRTQIVKVK